MKTKRRILVDGDACPVRDAVKHIAERFEIEALWFANSAQEVPESAYLRRVPVDDRRDAADFAIVSACREGDIVVTDDLGLVAMALGTGAEVVSSRGRRFKRDAMPALLERRHAARKVRRAGGRTRGPRALSSEARSRFRRTLEAMLADETSA